MSNNSNQFIFSKKIFLQPSHDDLLKKYDVIRQLGKGTYGRVYEIKNKITGEVVACKQLSIIDINDKEKVLKEFKIMRNLDHPNLVKLYEAYEDEHNFYLIMELCNGRELFEMIIDHIQSGKMYTEKEAANIFKQIMMALAYCHVNNICHRDLKPENILLSSNDKNSLIKILDFGLSKIFDNSKMTAKVGTAFYVSPEVLQGCYNEKCDIWSAGVILYILLSGCPPFDGCTDNEVYNKILNFDYSFPEDSWGNISEEAIDLIQKMLCPEENRLSAEDVMKHPWFKIIDLNKKIENLNIDLTLFKKYVDCNNLKKMILTYIASKLNDDEVIELKKLFDAIDKNHNGVISFKEFEEIFKQFNCVQEDLEKMFSALDINKDGVISYNEFLACTINQQMFLKDQRLYEAFRAIDKDNCGKISNVELKELLRNENEDVINEIIHSCNKNGDGEIDYNEFIDIMNSDSGNKL